MSRITGRGTPADITLESDTDMYVAATYQWTFVGLAAGAAGGPQCRITPVTSGANKFILQDNPKQYKGGRIRLRGTSSLKVDGTAAGGISVGTMIKPSTGGKGIAVTAGDAYSAIALEASAADGDIIEVICERGLSHA